MKVEPIGSVVKVTDRLFFVVGYQPVEDGGAVALAYILLPYPAGFVRAQDFILCPIKLVDEVISAGYADERSRRYLNHLTEFASRGKDADYEAFLHFMSQVKKTLRNQQEV